MVKGISEAQRIVGRDIARALLHFSEAVPLLSPSLPKFDPAIADIAGVPAL
jgi:hypothetical protein